MLVMLVTEVHPNLIKILSISGERGGEGGVGGEGFYLHIKLRNNLCCCFYILHCMAVARNSFFVADSCTAVARPTRNIPTAMILIYSMQVCF